MHTLALSGAAVLLLMVTGGLQWIVFGASAGLLAAGYWAGRSLQLRHAAQLSAERESAARESSRMTRMVAQSAPILARQIETVRATGDTEIQALARVFGGIAHRLERGVGPTGENGAPETQDEMLAALARNGVDLDALVAALQALQASKARIVGDIGVQVAQLKENATEICQIALQTRIVALNATIEAARAGAAGKPFAVIVAHMRELAGRTASASEQFSRHTDSLHGMVQAAFREGDAGLADASIPWAQQLVRQVVQRFDAMTTHQTQSIAAMQNERHDLRHDISSILVSLQFQDRVSQILSHVSRNLEDLEAGRWADMDDLQTMKRMAQGYSTQEEFDNQSGQAVKTATQAGEVTFF